MKPYKVRREDQTPVDRIISDAYYNSRHGFEAKPALFKRAKEMGGSDVRIQQKDVDDFLSRQTVHSVKTRVRRSNFVPAPPARMEVQADLFQMGDDYALAVIDTFTKLLDVVPIPNTESETVAEGFLHIIQKRAFGIPDSVSTDGGSHFMGAFDRMCHYFDIKHVIQRVFVRFVDRAIRTIRESFWQRRKGMDLTDWKKLLPDILSQYNERIHSGTGMAPQELLSHPEKDHTVFKKMIEDSNLSKKKPLEVGDQVRILSVENTWKASEEPDWSETLHVVLHVHHTNQGTLYDVSGHTHMLTRSSLLFVAKEGVSANEMPDVGRPLEERLSLKKDTQARRYQEYLPLAIRILWHTPGKAMRSVQLLNMIGANFKNANEFFRLFPKYFTVEPPATLLKRTVTHADGYRDGASLLEH